MAKRSSIISALRTDVKLYRDPAFCLQVELDKKETNRQKMIEQINNLNQAIDSQGRKIRSMTEAQVQVKSHLLTMSMQYSDTNRALALGLLHLANLIQDS